MANLKYPKEFYIDSGFFDGDMDCEYINRTEKLVKCRKDHECVNCRKKIRSGDYAVNDSTLFPGEGWKSCYICTHCIEGWLEESGQVDVKKDR